MVSLAGEHADTGSNGRRSFREPAVCALRVAALLAVSGFLASELVLLLKGWLRYVWTPYVVGDLCLALGALLAIWSTIRRRPVLLSFWRGLLIAGATYGVFLAVTVGLIAANAYSVQLPNRLGPVYRYDPRVAVPNQAVVLDRPEDFVKAYLERERALPKSDAWIESTGRGPAFAPGTTLHRVASYEVGSVLIRRVPTEVWWDDDPTFVATIDLHVKFVDGEQRDFGVEMLSGSGLHDPLGLLAQGYLTPVFTSWRPTALRLRHPEATEDGELYLGEAENTSIDPGIGSNRGTTRA